MQAQNGCTDPLAINYNAAASVNDGSCVYSQASVSPYNVSILNDTLSETSGLVLHNNLLWTHNDNSDTRLFALDTGTGQIVHRAMLQQVANIDWEEITQDSSYFYLGDFGNNVNGNRTDLRILRIAKNSLYSSNITVDTIRFSYADQTNFTATGANNTDFDCEAFIATTDSLYLFTKQWVSKKTCVYVLPKTPSPTPYAALPKVIHDVQGLITGATYLKEKNLIVLSGYNINPFVYLLYDFKGTNFFSANKRKIDISQPLLQVEAIATQDGRSFFLTNESLLSTPARLQKIDLSAYLNPYYQTAIATTASVLNLTIFPNPTRHQFTVSLNATKQVDAVLQLSDMNGKRVYEKTHRLTAGNQQVTVNVALPAGNYLFAVKQGSETSGSQMVIVK